MKRLRFGVLIAAVAITADPTIKVLQGINRSVDNAVALERLRTRTGRMPRSTRLHGKLVEQRMATMVHRGLLCKRTRNQRAERRKGKHA